MDLTMSSKGQITIPKYIREKLHLYPGDKCMLLFNSDGRAVLLPKLPAARLKGMLGKPKKPLTVENMNRAVRKGQEEAYGPNGSRR